MKIPFYGKVGAREYPHSPHQKMFTQEEFIVNIFLTCFFTAVVSIALLAITAREMAEPLSVESTAVREISGKGGRRFFVFTVKIPGTNVQWESTDEVPVDTCNLRTPLIGVERTVTQINYSNFVTRGSYTRGLNVFCGGSR